MKYKIVLLSFLLFSIKHTMTQTTSPKPGTTYCLNTLPLLTELLKKALIQINEDFNEDWLLQPWDVKQRYINSFTHFLKNGADFIINNPKRVAELINLSQTNSITFNSLAATVQLDRTILETGKEILEKHGKEELDNYFKCLENNLTPLLQNIERIQ